MGINYKKKETFVLRNPQILNSLFIKKSIEKTLIIFFLRIYDLMKRLNNNIVQVVTSIKDDPSLSCLRTHLSIGTVIRKLFFVVCILLM